MNQSSLPDQQPGESFAEAVDRIDAENLSTTNLPMAQPKNPLLLPDTRLKLPKNVVYGNGMNWVPIFCANCGADGGLVPEENCTFAFYLCNPCAETYGDIEGTYLEPDAVFWEKVKQEQIEKYGRILAPAELVEILKDGDHPLTKLTRDRKNLERKAKGG